MSERPKRRLRAPRRAIAIWLPIVIAAAFILLIIFGVWRRVHARHEQTAFSKKQTQIAVNVVQIIRDTKPKELTLPGNIAAFQETMILPRVNGYVQNWKVDLGDNVQEGQVLAEIETPEIDQQLVQARANYDLADSTAARWRELASKKVVADQEYDEKETARRTAQSNLEQLEKTQNFKRIVAPFSGKITARRVEVGALVSPTTPLFGIAQSDPLRVFTYVPQSSAGDLREGLIAKIRLPEFPGQDFEGAITRTAGALDSSSRTMQVEVQVPNREGKLYAGMYAQVAFVLPNENSPIVAPSNVVMFRSDGPQVATVTADSRIHWQPIKIGRDYGTSLEILSGLPENVNAVMNPTDDLQEGLQVEVKPPEKPKEDGDKKGEPQKKEGEEKKK